MAEQKLLNDVFIVDALRTPLGRGRSDGAFSQIHPADLAGIVVKELVLRNNLDPKHIEDLIFGCASATGEQGGNIARTIARKYLDNSVPGAQINRWCGSGAEAVDVAVSKIMTGSYSFLIAGGVESMSRVPMGADMLPFPGKLSNIWKILTMGAKVINLTFPHGVSFIPMGFSSELIAKKYGLTRKELDEFSYQSHKKAAHAKNNGYFDREITAIQTLKGIIKHDEGIRENTTVEKMRTLKPAFKKDGVVTAGNSSQITDGAAAILLANESVCKKFNLKKRAKIIASHVVCSDPELQLLGPIDAIPKVLKKANLSINDIDLFEINEAFASVVLAVQKELKIPIEKINVNGGAIALGHPLGMSGTRLLVTLLYELERRNLKYGLSTLCIGGGQAIATIIER